MNSALEWGPGAADAGLPMELGLACKQTWRGEMGMAYSYDLGCFGTFGGRYLSVPYGFQAWLVGR